MINEDECETKTPNVEELLESFAEEVVRNFESYCHKYYLILRKEKVKSGKWAELLGEFFDIGKGLTEAIGNPPTKAATVVPLNILQKFVYGIGARFNREEAKKLSEKLYEIRNTPGEAMREVLVDASIEVFRRYERQLAGIKVDGCVQRALEKVAEDVTNRIVSYLKKNPKEELLFVDTFTKGVVLGTSKKRYISRGFTVENADGKEWNTSEMFERVGLIGDDHEYYRKLTKDDKFGSRLMFGWESPNFSDDGNSLTINNSEVRFFRRPNIGDGQYEYKLTSDICTNARKAILKKLSETFDTKSKNLVIDGNVDEILKTVQRILTTNTAKDEKKFVWFRVRDTVPNFSGRKKELEKLHKKLWKNRTKITAITGVSGMGKTELAVKYVHSYHDYYESVVWINAKETTTLDESFRTLAQDYLKLPMKEKINGVEEDKTMQKIVENAYAHLSEKEVLYIFDNVNNCKQIVEYLPVYRSHANSKSPFVLITTNNREWDSNVAILDLETLDKVDAINLIRKGLSDKFEIDGNHARFHRNVQEKMAMKDERLDGETDKGGATSNYLKEYENNARGLLANNKDDIGNLLKLVKAAFTDYYKKIQKLVETFDGFPLAIQQAVAYINYQKKMSRFYTVGDFLVEYKNKTKTLLGCDKFQCVTNRYEKTTYTACTITLDKIRRSNDNRSNLALQILNIVAYFSSDNIPIDFFADADNSSLRTQALELPPSTISLADESHGNSSHHSDNEHLEAVRLLHEDSLIKVNDYADSFGVQRLLQQVVRIEINSEGGCEEKVLRKALQMVKGNTKISYMHLVSIWSFVANENNAYTKLIDDFSESCYFEDTSPLHLLCLYGYGTAVRKIITHLEETDPPKAQSVMKKKDVFLFVPLLNAAIGGDVGIVRFLKKRYTDRKDGDVYNRCLHLAAIYGHVDLVKYLIEDERMELTTTHTGQPIPFELAVFAYGNLDIVKFVLEQKVGIKIRQMCNFRKNPDLAASIDRLHLLKNLLKEMRSPLHHAAENGHINVIEYLTKSCQVNVNEKTNDEQNCLHIASFHGHLNLVKYLVEDCSMNVSSVDKKGNKPYYLAAQKGHVEILRYFSKEHHVDVKVLGDDGNTFLHSAAYNGHLPMIKYLVEDEGFDVHLKDKSNKRASQYASNEEIINYLKEREGAQKETPP